MLEKFLNITDREVDKMADVWTNWKRVYEWNKKPRVTDKDIQDFYDNIAVEYVCDLHKQAQIQAPFFLGQLGDCKGLKVLDFGCGTGEYGYRLAQAGADVTFLDSDNLATQFLRWRLKETGIKGTFISEFSKLADTYDVILCIDVLEHIKKPTELLKKLTAKLKEGGRILISTPMIEPITTNGNPRFNWEQASDCEHLQVSINDWVKHKTNDWLINNLVNNGNVFTKPMARILLIYNFHPHTTGRYLEDALRKTCLVMTNRQIPIQPNGEGIRTACEKLKIDFVLQVDTGAWWRLPSKLPCKTACYSVDTFSRTEYNYNLLKNYDVRFFAQKRFAIEKRDHWMPLAADVGIYKPVITRKKWDISFVGTHIVKDSQHARNEYFKQIVRDFAFYIGKESNEMANLRYNEAYFVFNYGIANDINMRVFEGMASGAVLLMNKVDDMAELGFVPGVNYLEYKDYADMKQQIFDILVKPEEVQKICEAGVKLIRERHTYDHRAREIVKIMMQKV